MSLRKYLLGLKVAKQLGGSTMVEIGALTVLWIAVGLTVIGQIMAFMTGKEVSLLGFIISSAIFVLISSNFHKVLIGLAESYGKLSDSTKKVLDADELENKLKQLLEGENASS